MYNIIICMYIYIYMYNIIICMYIYIYPHYIMKHHPLSQYI